MDPNETEVVSQEETPQADAPQAGATGDTAAELARLQKEIADLRKENAKHRTANREAERKAAEEAGQFKTLYEQTMAELETLKADAAKRGREALLHRVAKTAGLPDDLADRLRGETEDELLADAKAMAKRLAVPAPSTGATNPGRGADQPQPKKRYGIRGIG